MTHLPKSSDQKDNSLSNGPPQNSLICAFTCRSETFFSVLQKQNEATLEIQVLYMEKLLKALLQRKRLELLYLICIYLYLQFIFLNIHFSSIFFCTLLFCSKWTGMFFVQYGSETRCNAFFENILVYILQKCFGTFLQERILSNH